MKKFISLFGIKKRRAEQRAEQVAQAAAARQKMFVEREARLESRKTVVDRFLDEKRRIANEQAKVAQEKDKAEVAQKNAVCPVCGSRNRIHKFAYIKGELDGSSKGSFSGGSSLFGSHYSGYSSGHIHGELDTHEVNECKDCGNQWKIVKPKHTSMCDYRYNPWSIVESEGLVGFLYRRLHYLLDETPEEREKEIEDISPCSPLCNFKNTPRMVLENLLYTYHFSWEGYGRRRDRDDFLLHTPICKDEESEKYNDDPYLFEFSEEDWEFVKRVVKYEAE